MLNTENIDVGVKIDVIGVGGGGNNAALHIINEKVKNIETYLLNTELGAIKRINYRNILQIGKETTKGLGAGANETVGENAARESREDIEKILQNTDMLFITAGMGGGTGTGAAPVVAEIAKEKEILTVGVVTKPFMFEGKLRKMRAESGINKLKDNVNALIVILNDNLLKVANKNTPLKEAFSLANDVVKQGIQSITDLITTVGQINLDFADIRTIFSYKGNAYMGIGKSFGEARVKEAIQQAIENPLTESKIDGAKGVIFNVTGGENLSLAEIDSAIKIINDRVDEDANIIFGTVIDNNLNDEVKVTVIATGIEEKQKK